MCTCKVLLQAGDLGQLGCFLADKAWCFEVAVGIAGENPAKVWVLLTFQSGDFKKLYCLLESWPFGAPHHPLQSLVRSCTPYYKNITLVTSDGVNGNVGHYRSSSTRTHM